MKSFINNFNIYYMKFLKNFENFTKEERYNLVIKNLTYLRPIEKFGKKPSSPEIDNIVNEIRNYDYNIFNVVDDGFEITIPFNTNFKNLINYYSKLINDNIGFSQFELSVDRNLLNSININFKLPKNFRGLYIGKNVYLLMCKKFGFITSDYGCSKEANNLWYSIICDNKVYSATSGYYHNENDVKGFTFIIYKDQSLDKILETLKFLKNNIEEFDNFIFDEELKQIIKIM